MKNPYEGLCSRHKCCREIQPVYASEHKDNNDFPSSSWEIFGVLFIEGSNIQQFYTNSPLHFCMYELKHDKVEWSNYMDNHL